MIMIENVPWDSRFINFDKADLIEIDFVPTREFQLSSAHKQKKGISLLVDLLSFFSIGYQGDTGTSFDFSCRSPSTSDKAGKYTSIGLMQAWDERLYIGFKLSGLSLSEFNPCLIIRWQSVDVVVMQQHRRAQKLCLRHCLPQKWFTCKYRLSFYRTRHYIFWRMMEYVIWWTGGTYTLKSTLEQLGLKDAILVAIKNKTERVVVDYHLEAYVLWIWLPTGLRLWSDTTIPSLPLPSLYSTWASKVSLQHSSMCFQLLIIWGWWWPNNLVSGKIWCTNSDSARYSS